MLPTAVTRNGTVMTKRTPIMSRCGTGHVLDAWKFDGDWMQFNMQCNVVLTAIKTLICRMKAIEVQRYHASMSSSEDRSRSGVGKLIIFKQASREGSGDILKATQVVVKYGVYLLGGQNSSQIGALVLYGFDDSLRFRHDLHSEADRSVLCTNLLGCQNPRLRRRCVTTRMAHRR